MGGKTTEMMKCFVREELLVVPADTELPSFS